MADAKPVARMTPFAALAPDVLVRSRHAAPHPTPSFYFHLTVPKKEKKTFPRRSKNEEACVWVSCPSAPTRLPPSLRAAFEAEDRADRAREIAREVHSSKSANAALHTSFLHDDDNDASVKNDNNVKFHLSRYSRAGLLLDDDDSDDVFTGGYGQTVSGGGEGDGAVGAVQAECSS